MTVLDIGKASVGTPAPPTLAPIANQTVAAGQSLKLTLQGTDPNGLPLTYGATAETQLFYLKSTYGIYEDAGGYYTNYRGQHEKYLRGKVSANGYSDGGSDFWYYILPNGDLYEFTPPYTTPTTIHHPTSRRLCELRVQGDYSLSGAVRASRY
jgi:hypothetical protein